MTASHINTLRLPYGYTVTQDGDHFRLWRSSEVSPTDDGYPDEIEEGYTTPEEAAQSAWKCAKYPQVA